MPLPSVRARFLALAVVALAAACSARQGGDALPQSQPFVRAAGSPAPALTHAPCGIRPGYHAPLVGDPAVVTAFGQLEYESKTKVYSVAQGVDLASKPGQIVRSAQAGRLAYRSIEGFRKAAIVTGKNGAQTLYGPLEGNAPFPKGKAVAAGAIVGRAERASLHFEITGTQGLAGGRAAQENPCGLADGASGTVSLLPESATANVSLTSFTLGTVRRHRAHRPAR